MAGVMPSTQWEMKNYHQRYYPGNTISVGIGQGETQVTPLQLARALGGIASDGHMVRPHVVAPDQLPAQFRQAVLDSFPGSGDVNVPLRPDTWNTITEGMAAATTPGLYHTAEAAHLDGIDFAGKTGTAQVVGSGDTHVKGGAKTPNSWFVGMAPRRNPEIVIAVLQEHGDWGSNSAKIAAQLVTVYVNKKRRQDHNILDQASLSKPVEVGALWSEPRLAGRKRTGEDRQDSVLHMGHFMVNPSADPRPAAGPRSLATGQLPLPVWLLASPLRLKKGQP
jgi:penicillin-binding protein 2